MPESLKALGAQRDALLVRILELLQGDERVAGAWLSGSFGRDDGEPDVLYKHYSLLSCGQMLGSIPGGVNNDSM